MAGEQAQDQQVMWDFFVSFTGADRPWATWLVAELDAAGYRTVSQLREFVAGGNFMADMRRAAASAHRTLGVLSASALESGFVQQEWNQRLAQDPGGRERALVLVRVEECKPEELLGPVLYIDLVGLDEAAARQRLREEVAAAIAGQRSLGPVAFPGAPAAAVAGGRVRFPSAYPKVWNLPYRRNLVFTGREDLLDALAGALGEQDAVAVTQAISGLGGVGKTALAVEYAYRYRAEFDLVWWVHAEQPTTLLGDLAGLAAALELPEHELAAQDQMALAVRHWLQRHDRWLLILDNAEGPDSPTGLAAPLGTVASLLPQAAGGQVLVTSRDASWEDEVDRALAVDVLNHPEAVALLCRRTGQDDEDAAGEIAELLGGLPLALEQAGAFIQQTQLALGDYLDKLRQFPQLTLAKGKARAATAPVATTWQVSLDQVRQTPGAVEVLECCAFLAPDDIPRDLFTVDLDSVPDWLTSLHADPFGLDEAVGVLRRFSLVKATPTGIGVHRLLQQVIRGQLPQEDTADRLGLVVRLLRGGYPVKSWEAETWPLAQRLLAHVLAACQHARHEGVELGAVGWLLVRAANSLRVPGQFIEANALLDQAMSPPVELDQADRAVTETSLGLVLRDLGDLAGARPHYERALEITEVAFGPNHPDVATARGNLGGVLWDLGDLAGARAQLERALEISEAALGPNHPTVAIRRTNLGVMLRELGDLAGAREQHERALEISEAALGPNHPTVAIRRTNLGVMLRDLGDQE
jgi:tetratricopeptide (TPR) repeat protein